MTKYLSSAILLSMAVSSSFASWGGSDIDRNEQESSERTFSLAHGFNEDSFYYTNLQCLNISDDDIESIVLNEASVDMDASTNYSELLEELKFSINGEYTGAFYSSNALLDFTNRTKETETTVSMTYVGKLLSHQLSFSRSSYSYSDVANGHIEKDLENGNKILFRSYCGDNFISDLTKGALLLINVTLDFQSKSVKDKYKARFEGSTPVMEITTEINKLNISEDEKIDIKVSAYQLGGDARRLFSIIPAGSASRCLFTRENDGMTDCQEMVEGLFAYADDFGKQLEDISKHVTISYNTQTYKSVTSEDHSGPKLRDQDDGKIRKAQKTLEESYNHLSSEAEFLNSTKNQFQDENDFLEDRVEQIRLG